MADEAEVTPIDLPLESWRRLEADGCGRSPRWTVVMHNGTQLGFFAWIPLR